MNKTHINIKGNDSTYKYVAEWIPVGEGIDVSQYFYDIDGLNVYFYNDEIYLKRVGNDWVYIKGLTKNSEYIPSKKGEMYKVGKLRIYFPEYSVDTYEGCQDYAITINTWIRNRELHIGSFILNRIDAVACDEIKIINGEKYLEYIDLLILDPYDISYSDNWSEFRNNICKESYILPIINNEYVTKLIDILRRLYPVDFNWDYDDDFNNLYQQLEELQYSISDFVEHENEFIRYRRVLRVLSEIIVKLYGGDFNRDFCDDFNIEKENLTFSKILQIIQKFEPSDFNNDYNEDYAHIDIPFKDGSDKLTHNDTKSILNISLYPVFRVEDSYIMRDGYTGGYNSINITDEDDYLGLDLNIIDSDTIRFNIRFNDEYHSNLKFYLYETYGIISDNHKFELVVKDNDNIYYEYSLITQENDIVINRNTISNNKYNIFESNSQFIDGCVLMGTATFYDENNEDKLIIKSNEIPLTIELYSRLCKNNYGIYNIDLNSVDMIVYNINAVNKIINNIINVDNPKDSRSNIIAPIFYKTNDIGSIVIHSEVNENICINLDGYKSKVKSFYIQIEGVVFPEVGRTSNGVVFKIIGSRLPNKYNEGTLYILNEDQELVTTGKYKYNV